MSSPFIAPPGHPSRWPWVLRLLLPLARVVPALVSLSPWLWLWLPGLALLLGGCASAPPATPPVVSTARVAAESTLARAAAGPLAGAAAGESAFRLLPDGDEALAARLALLQQAQDSVDLMTYLLSPDASGHAVVQALERAAARGVRVRLLVDDLAAVRSDALFAALAARPGVSVRMFNPLRSALPSPALRLLLSGSDFDRAHRRMHNKLLLVDGAVAVTGGRNIADEYFMLSERGNFVDMDVLAVGAVVPPLATVFDRFWNSAFAADWPTLRGAAQRRAAASAERTADPVARPALPGFDAFGPGRSRWHRGTARVLADDPQRVAGHPVDQAATDHGALNQALLDLSRAQHAVTVVSPYFIPGPRGLGLIESAVRRGVRLQVVTNSATGTDEPLAHWHYTAYRQRLLSLGVDLYEFTGPAERAHGRASSAGRLHSKLAVVDGQRVLIGSMNMDARSAWLNTELGLQIDSPALAADLLQRIEASRQGETLAVRPAPHGRGPQWVAGAGPQAQVLPAEPGLGLPARLRLGLLSLLISEDWL